MKVTIMVCTKIIFVQDKFGYFGPQLGKSYSAALTFKYQKSTAAARVLLEISTFTQAKKLNFGS